ncbi:efflux RND transporter periplasmic adaptor subunit [Mesonia maritima]|uniref:RND family efflux transporter MFP subunit n=1 Tax=Mesonia maritima TaxID=1793873 RepID=A0ABU1K5W5_9FLAO|nr:efflux RND transporter periplasmic adaptor subunit [Mesonia maritima]MDR6301006.1 RND family efflux transporter MFP subunit [Mesonia maritima]
MKKIIYSIIIGAIVLGGAIYLLLSNKEQNQQETALITQKNDAISVKVDTVKRITPQLSYRSNGTFKPEQELIVTPETTGTILEIMVKEGDQVHKGQTLAYLKKDQAKVSYQNANANYQNALENYERYQRAYKTGGVTQEQLEQMQLQLDNAKSSLENANLDIEDTRIKASINGVINKKFVETGAVVNTGTSLFEIVDITTLKLQVSVPELQVSNIQSGQQAQIQLNVYPDTTFTGNVSFVAAKADGSLNFPIEITLQNSQNHSLKAGMYATAIFNFSSEEIQPISVISRNAFTEGLGESDVFVVKNNQVHLQKVRTGRNLNNQVEILDGLQVGDVVVTSGQINLENQSAIQIIQ